MERMMMKSVEEWYKSNREQVLFIRGAAGVGKTWLIREFCGKHNIEYMYLPVPSLDCLTRGQIEKEATLIFFDDINSLSDMKNAADILAKVREDDRIKCYDIIMAGQITEDKLYDDIFPDRSIMKYMEMYPMNFHEFYNAVSERFKFGRFDILKMYMITGGMPEAVRVLLRDGNLTAVRACQKEIMDKIYGGFSNGKNYRTSKEEDILSAVTGQTFYHSTGFSFRQINKNARPREYENAINNLLQHGIIYRICRFAPNSEKGIANYKLMIFDIGLLGMLAGVNENILYDEEKLFDRTFVTAFFLQEIISYGVNMSDIMYWYKPRAKARLSVVMKKSEKIIPVELVAKPGVKSKSIESFMDTYKVFSVIRIMKADRHENAYGRQEDKVYCEKLNECCFELWEAGYGVSDILNRLK